MSIFSKKLKNIPYDKVVFIPLNKDFIKFERFGKEEHILGKDVQPNIGSRIWLDIDKISYSKKREKSIMSLNKSFILPIFKRKGKLLDYYELHPAGEEILLQFIQKYEDMTENKDFHITLSKIKDEELYSYTVLRIKNLETPKKEGQLPFLAPNEDVLLQIVDFKDIPLTGMKKISNEEAKDIRDELKKLYLSDDEIETIKEWLHIEDFISGKGKFEERSGLILYGPPGTGKTFAASEIFSKIFKEKLNFGFEEVKMSELIGGESSGYVGGFAKAMSGIFTKAFNEIIHTRRPYFVFIDEATDLVRATGDNSSGDKWISEGIEIFKNYLNPIRYPGVIFCLCTNLVNEESFNHTILNQRLGGIYFPLPPYEKAYNLWKEDIIPKHLKPNNFTILDDERNLILISEICADTITVRTIYLFIKSYIKNNSDINSLNNFEKFKNSFLELAEKEIELEHRNNINKALNKNEIEDFNQLYNIQKNKLIRIKEGLTLEEHRTKQAKIAIDIQEGEVKKVYTKVVQELKNLYNLFKQNPDIVNDNTKFNNFLINLLHEIEYLIKYLDEDSDLNHQISERVISLLNRMKKIIIGIENDNFDEYTLLLSAIKGLPEANQLFNPTENFNLSSSENNNLRNNRRLFSRSAFRRIPRKK